MILLFRFLACLPLCWVHRIGAFAGWLVYLLSPRYRRHLRENVRQAGLPDSVRRQAIPEAGKQMLELSKIWMRPLAEATDRVVEVEGWAHVEEAMAGGRGILFLTPHLGCFEITAQYFSRFADITVLFRPPRYAALQQLIEQGRQRGNLHLAPADLSGVRSLIKALKRGQAVGMLPDQAPKAGEGVWLDFFGRPAYTMTLAARLTETGAVPLMAWAERLPEGRGYCLRLRPPAQPFSGDTAARALQINKEIEALIRECPAQYLWGYNRFKRRGGGAPPA